MNAASWLASTGLLLPLLVAAAVALLYLLRPPPRSVLVPSILLWRPIAERRRSHTLLRRLASALLSLAVALCLAFALTGLPRFPRRGAEQIVVVDDSATLATRAGGLAGGLAGGGAARLELAVARARELVEEWGGPTLLADTTGRSAPRWVRSPAEAEGWLRDLGVSSARPRLPALGGSSEDAAEPARRVLITDGVAVRPPPDWRIESVFSPARNVGVVAFGAANGFSSALDAGEAFLEVHNASREPVTTRVVVSRTEGRPLFERELALDAGETWSGLLVLPVSSGAGTTGAAAPNADRAPSAGPAAIGDVVEACLETPGDALAADDCATARVRNVRTLRIATIGVAGALDRVLRLLPSASIVPARARGAATTAGTSDATPSAGASADFDLIVASGWAPETPPPVPALLFAPPPRSWLPEPVQALPSTTVRARTPTGEDWGPLTAVELRRYAFTPAATRASEARPEILLTGTIESASVAADAPLIETAINLDLPLVFELRGLPAPVVVAALSVEGSTLARHEAFPVLVSELVERLASPAGSAPLDAVRPPGLRVTDVNATALPPLSADKADRAASRAGAGPSGPKSPRQRERRVAIAVLLASALFAGIETLTRSRGWTE
jgi:hypothetical protein